MKKNIFLIILIWIFTDTSLYAQWAWYNPIPNANPFYSIEILSDSIIIILDDCGNAFLTKNNGDTFEEVSNFPNEFYPIEMQFVSKYKGWFLGSIGNKNVLVSTIDGCDTFVEQLVGHYSSMFFLNEEIGWITSSDSVYYTINAGNDWVNIGYIPFNFHKIQFLDNNFGYAIRNNQISKTTDGGYNWEIIYNDVGNIFSSLFFINDTVGYVVGRNVLNERIGVILKTIDGGNDWLSKEMEGYLDIYSIKFASETIGFFNGLGYVHPKMNVGISKTVDGGINWNRIKIIEYENGFVQKAGEIDTYNGNKLISVFGNNSLIIGSEDLGNSWTSISKDIFADSTTKKYKIQNICFPTENIGYMLTEKGVYKTQNSGQNWILIKTFKSYIHLNHISASDELNVWVIGKNGEVFKSIDGGNNWDLLDNVDAFGNLRKVVSLTNNKIFILESEWVQYSMGYGYWITSIVSTHDAGLTWKREALGDYEINDIFFLSEMKAWAVGDQIVFTENGGDTWVQIGNSPQYNGFVSVKFISNSIGFSIGKLFGVFKTIDGGHNWEQLSNINSSVRFYDINFRNNLNGSLVGRNGLILSTNDGGNTWLNNSIKTTTDFNSLYFNDKKGWLIGDNHSILFKDFNLIYVELLDERCSLNSFNLYQNFPNPFNPNTKITYTVPKRSHVILNVYDVLGRQILNLVDEEKSIGTYQVEFNASNLSSGIYIYQLKANDFKDSRKMILLH